MEEKEPHVFDFSEGPGFWGHHVEITDMDKSTGFIKGNGHIGEHIPPRVQVDDLLKVRGKKGYLMTFRFTKVKYMSNPTDMFFFDAEFVSEVSPDEQRAA